MACVCGEVEQSYFEKPFFVPGTDMDPFQDYPRLFTCECGQRWWCFNSHYCLWARINDDATWLNVSQGCPSPVIIGSGGRSAENMYGKKK